MESKINLCVSEMKTNCENTHTNVSKNTEKFKKICFEVLMTFLSKLNKLRIYVGYMHAPRSIQMNSCLLFFILCFYFTHSIILIHFYESLFFTIFSSILFSFIRAFIRDAALHMCFRFEATRVLRHFGRSRLLGGHLLPHAATRLLPRFPRVCIR